RHAGGHDLVATWRAPVERRFAEPDLDPSVSGLRLVHFAHGGEELDEPDHRRRWNPADRVVPDLAEFDVGNALAGKVPIDHRLMTAGAELDHQVADVASEARVTHEGGVELHLLGETVGVPQGYDRVVLEDP